MRDDTSGSAGSRPEICPLCHGSRGMGGIFGCKCVDNTRLMAMRDGRMKKKCVLAVVGSEMGECRGGHPDRGGDEMAESWLVGRKEISHYMNVCWDTVRKWRREHGCPVHTGPGGRPTALVHELDRWLVQHCRGGEGDARPDAFRG